MSSVRDSFDVRGMNSKGSYFRSGQSMNSEIRSWSKNKMEDRRLAQRHDEVDRNMVIRRKSHLFEKDKLNKEINEKICKTTPSTDEYLDRSYHRYAGWRERERERLDRRYNSIYKSYIQDLKSISKGEQERNARRKKKTAKNAEEESDVVSETTEGTAEDNVDDKKKVDDSFDTDDDEANLLAISNLNINEGHRRFTVDIETMPTVKQELGGVSSRRRGSTGGIMLPSDFGASSLKHVRSLNKIEETELMNAEKITIKETNGENVKTDAEVLIDREEPEAEVNTDADYGSKKVKPKRGGRRVSAGDILQQLQTSSKKFSRRPSVAIPMYSGKK